MEMRMSVVLVLVLAAPSRADLSIPGRDGGAARGCTASAATGSLEVRFGVQGCFDGVDHLLKVEWRSDGSATLSGSIDETGQTRSFSDRVSRVRAQAIARELAAAAQRREFRSWCESTNVYYATLTWSCGDGDREQSFSSSACPRTVHSETTAASERRTPYARAIAVFDLAERTLREAATRR
jgi:hypothetical protein